MYQMNVYMNIQCGIHWLCARPVQVHRPHPCKSLCLQTCQLPQRAPVTEIYCQLFLAVKVPPVRGRENQCSTRGTDWRQSWQEPLLYPLCHKPLACVAEVHCFIQGEVLWEQSIGHSFSIAVLISAHHQHIKDLVDVEVASSCGGRVVLLHQEGSRWSHFHFGQATSHSLMGFARICVDTGAQSVQRLK